MVKLKWTSMWTASFRGPTKVSVLSSPRDWADLWAISPTQVNCRSWWWTGRPGMLQSMGSQRVGHDWVTEMNWTELNWVLMLMCIWSNYCFFLPYIFKLFIYFRLCWVFNDACKLSLVAVSWGYCLVVVQGPFIAVASLVAGRWLSSLWPVGWVAPGHVGCSQTRDQTDVPCIH